MTEASSTWSADRSAELYNLAGWGSPYFRIDERGSVVARPGGSEEPDAPEVALDGVVEMAKQEGLSLPLLVRLNGILGHRVKCLSTAFANAAADYGWKGRHRPVYPIKVNQQRHVVEELLRAGRGVGLGLEVGSKPELLAMVALLEHPSLVICNGYKDEAYIEMAALAVRLGHEVVVVVEKPSEIETFARVIEREGREAAPFLGVRARLSSQGSGRWVGSAGDRAKFGLSVAQLVECVEWLASVELLDRLRLLHFHIGSQITAIRPWKTALQEASRLFVELRKLGAPLDLFDVGGGLAVDYDGSNTNYVSSRNYSEQEYANDVVWQINNACAMADMPAPDIVTETGRALVAHHSLMIVEVTGAARLTADAPAPPHAGTEEDKLVAELRSLLERVSEKAAVECFHDAVECREQLLQRFKLGLIDLPTRALGEQVFFAVAERVAQVAEHMDPVPDELSDLRTKLADTYFCNFSVFQSIPDHWAIRQVFPVIPIHRLNEKPAQRAVLGDMTCDSDGKIDRFADLRETQRVLPVHPLREGESYMLGIFLVGAYQETLGDLHNLFGDTDVVHVDFTPEGKPRISAGLRGESVGEVLRYVGYDEAWLMGRYDGALARLVKAEQLTSGEADQVRGDLVRGLGGNTYLTAREVARVREDDLIEAEDPLDGIAGDTNPASSTEGTSA
ncbi:MAG: biosynthetic arginine decarboxylase [Planctomycetota bacterium]|nr:MAG: biosynthetic arginine decarboxylase [Planctomycetota bacterium]